jgi:pimeloyl-ACP methyl ester carboxylesterase
MTTSTFENLNVGGRDLRIEYLWVGVTDPSAPLVVFLHEGLGSVAMWRDFPARLCDAIGARGLVYSRPGYGQSTPRTANEKWGADFMHIQARDVLPALLAAIAPDARPWLLGHSDGGSIALIFAALFPEKLAGVVALAPHIFVEDIALASIAKARDTYLSSDLRARLARYHVDVDSAFWGWNEIWLSPAFRRWTIEPLLSQIRCPLLALQGVDDEYGTMAQIDGIAQAAPHASLLKIEHCGHSPHRDQPEEVIEAVTRCMVEHRTSIRAN